MRVSVLATAVYEFTVAVQLELLHPDPNNAPCMADVSEMSIKRYNTIKKCESVERVDRGPRGAKHVAPTYYNFTYTLAICTK